MKNDISVLEGGKDEVHGLAFVLAWLDIQYLDDLLVEKLTLLRMLLEEIPLGNDFFDPLPSYLQSTLHVPPLLSLACTLRLLAEAFHHG